MGFFLRVTKHFQVKFFLVAKVVIDGRDVRAGALADFPHGGVAEAALGKHGAGCFQQLLARLRVIVGGDGTVQLHLSNR